MPEAIRSGSRARLPRLTLNSDGQRHPLQNALTAFTFAAGIVAFAVGFIVRAHLVGTGLGLPAFAVGLYAQMISATREQRAFLMAAIVAPFVGIGLTVRHTGSARTRPPAS